MPEEARSNPPDLNADEQTAAASDFEMNRMRSMQGYGESSEGDLLKGDIASERAPRAVADEIPEEEQREVETSLRSSRQQLGQIRKAEAKLEGGGKVGSTGSGKLFTGSVGLIIQKVPGIGMLENIFKKAGLRQKIKTLERMKSLLKLAKTAAALWDAGVSWLEVAGALSETIIVPILMVLFSPLWFFFLGFIFQKGPTAKAIGEAIRTIDKALLPIKKLWQQEEQRKAAMANLRNMEMAAANEQAQNVA